MSARRLIDDLLVPFERSFAAYAGPFILEFPPVRAAAGIDSRFHAADIATNQRRYESVADLKLGDRVQPVLEAVQPVEAAAHVVAQQRGRLARGQARHL
jgi:hypothetical protein